MGDPLTDALNEINGGTPTKPITWEDPQGNLCQFDPETGKWTQAPGTPSQWPKDVAPPKPVQFTDPNDGSVWFVDPTTGERLKRISPPIPGYIPGYGVQAPKQPATLAPRYEDEAEGQRLLNEGRVTENQNRLLEQEQLRQKMKSKHEQTIGDIQGMIARGEIDQNEADRLAGLSLSALDAQLRGTNLYQMKRDAKTDEHNAALLDVQKGQLGVQEGTLAQTKKNNLNTLASNILADRMTAGNSMAQGLFNGGLQAFKTIRPNAAGAFGFNPMMLAKGFTNDMGGGQELSDWAKAILAGAMAGGQ